MANLTPGVVAACVAASADELCEHWFGWTFPPVDRAIADAAFEPDGPGEYCGRCGDSVAPGEATKDGCATCRIGAELSGGIADGVVRLAPYMSSVRSWLHAVKYQRWTEMAETLGAMLGRALRDRGCVDCSNAIVVPMPMPWQRRVFRGIDHAGALARALATELGAPSISILGRMMHPPQVSLTPSERRRAGSRGMYIKRRWRRRNTFEGTQFVLVDDVRTTGSTLKSATRLLNRLKPDRVVCAVVAVSDSRARQMRRNRRSTAGPAQGASTSESLSE